MSKDLEQLSGVIQACMLQRKFEAEIKEYDNRPFLSRVFSRRPRRPVEGMSRGQLEQCATDAFQASYPDLALYFEPSKEFPFTCKAAFGLAFDVDGSPKLTVVASDDARHVGVREYFVLDKDLHSSHFVPEYQIDGDIKKNRENKEYAYRSMLANRKEFGHCSDFFEGIDQMCKDMDVVFTDSNASVRSGKVNLKEVRKSVSHAVEQGKTLNRNASNRAALIAMYKRNNPLEDGRDYEKIKRDMNDEVAHLMRGEVLPSHKAKTIAKCLAYKDMLDKVDSVKLFRADLESDFCHLSASDTESMQQLHTVTETEFLERHGHRPDLLDNKECKEFYEMFAHNSMLDGCTPGQIKDFFERRLDLPFPEVCRPDFDRVEKEAARQYREMLDYYVDNRYVQGSAGLPARIAIMGEASPKRMLQEKASHLVVAEQVRMELSKAGLPAFDNKFLRENPRDVALAVARSDRPEVSLDAVAKVTVMDKIEKDRLVSAYDDVLSVNVRDAIGHGAFDNVSFGIKPEERFSEQVFDAVSHYAKNEPDKLGSFLRQVGYKPSSSFKEAESLKAAAVKLYENGKDGKAYLFLEKHFDAVSAGRKARKAMIKDKDRSVSEDVHVSSSFLPKGTVYEVSKADIEENRVPPGCDVGVDSRGRKFLSSFNQNRYVPDEGLVLVKNVHDGNLYDVMTKKQFSALYEVKDGIASKRNVAVDLKPGTKKEQDFSVKR